MANGPFHVQWRSQGLELGWAQAVWGTGVPQRGPGAHPRWRSGAKPPEARYAYRPTTCSGQTHFRGVHRK